VLNGAGIEATVRAVTSEPIGTGQMGSCYRLAIDYERGKGPARLVVKLPASDPVSRAYGKWGYRCEVGFYHDVASRVSVRIPGCYFAAVTDEGDSFTLVLEDLAPAEQGDQIDGCTVVQARNAAVNVAGLHAPTWSDPSVAGLEWLIPMSPERADFTGAILKDATATFLERYEVAAATADVLAQFAERYVEWGTGRPEPFSLVHSDYRLDNLMFSPPDAADRVTAIDWQLVTIGLPLRDVAFMVGTGLHIQDRRAAERGIVSAYHEALVDLGIDDYDAQRCWDDYRFALFQGPLITVLGSLSAQPTERGDRMFTVMAERSAAAITDLDAFALL
jgi:hypothetical protein